MDDDFNTGGAIGDLFELVRLLNKQIEEQQLENPATRTADALGQLTRGVSVLRELSQTLGLFIQPVANTGTDQNGSVLGNVLQLVIRLRAEARAAKKYGVADKIRDALAEWKIVLEDRADATDWVLDGDPERALTGLVDLLIELRTRHAVKRILLLLITFVILWPQQGLFLEDRADGTDWAVEAG